jgi:hypothetical protein
LVYLNDSIIYSPNFEQHIEDLETGFELLERAGVILRLEKCHFFKQKVKYLRHIVHPGKPAG